MTPRSAHPAVAPAADTGAEPRFDAAALPPVDRLLSTREVLDRVNMGHTTLYRRIGDGTFPRPVRHGQANLWRESTITSWMNGLKEADSQYRGSDGGGRRGRGGRR